MKIPPAIKGIITGAIMIAAYVLLNNMDEKKVSTWQWLPYIIYALGIAWTLIAYQRSPGFTGKFGNTFSQGFKCFIIVTLMMALFYGIFNSMHPEFAEQTAQAYKTQLLKENQKTPQEVDSMIAAFKKQYTLKLVSAAIFGYLIIGAGTTAAVSALLSRRIK